MPFLTVASRMCWHQSRLSWSPIVSRKLNSMYEKVRSLRAFLPTFFTFKTHSSQGQGSSAGAGGTK